MPRAVRATQRILVVDDNTQIVGLIRRALEREKYEVRVATSGTQALSMLEQTSADLLIVDLNMPGIDGFDLIKMARATHPDLPTLVISGYLEGALLEAAEILCATATLQKPFTATELSAKVREALGQ